MATKRAFRACLPGDRNSCVNCADYLECPLAVCGGTKGNWVCDDWKMIRFGFAELRCSDSYAAYMEMVRNTVGGNIGHAIDTAWTWFRTGYVNNFISLNPHTKEINLNW